MQTKSDLFLKLSDYMRQLFSGRGFTERTIEDISHFIFLMGVLLTAFLLTWILHRVLTYSVPRILQVKRVKWLSLVLDATLLRKLSGIFPPLIVLALLPLAFPFSGHWQIYLLRIAWIWLVVASVMAVSHTLASVGRAMLSKETLHDRPMRSFIQILQVLVSFLGIIMVLSILVGKSPLNLITGLGAFAAVLMLVFKDTILGFVAGVLLAENDMVHLGDWIELPSAGVNGLVQDITLTVVKVRNWDNTIVTVPPYSLITGSFVNWRGMKQSGGRRIMRGFTLMCDYVKPCTTIFLERMKAFDPDLSEFIIRKQQQAARGLVVDTHNPEGLVDGSIETNLGLLRAYLTLYLKRHPNVNSSMELMVRTLPPTENGIPIQLYCFCKNKVWAEYESVQSGIMEHFLSVLPAFELQVYQNASSRDNLVNGLLEGGYEVNRIRNFPWGIVR